MSDLAKDSVISKVRMLDTNAVQYIGGRLQMYFQVFFFRFRSRHFVKLSALHQDCLANALEATTLISL